MWWGYQITSNFLIDHPNDPTDYSQFYVGHEISIEPVRLPLQMNEWHTLGPTTQPREGITDLWTLIYEQCNNAPYPRIDFENGTPQIPFQSAVEYITAVFDFKWEMSIVEFGLTNRGLMIIDQKFAPTLDDFLQIADQITARLGLFLEINSMKKENIMEIRSLSQLDKDKFNNKNWCSLVKDMFYNKSESVPSGTPLDKYMRIGNRTVTDIHDMEIFRSDYYYSTAWMSHIDSDVLKTYLKMINVLTFPFDIATSLYSRSIEQVTNALQYHSSYLMAWVGIELLIVYFETQRRILLQKPDNELNQPISIMTAIDADLKLTQKESYFSIDLKKAFQKAYEIRRKVAHEGYPSTKEEVVNLANLLRWIILNINHTNPLSVFRKGIDEFKLNPKGNWPVESPVSWWCKYQSI